MGVKTEKYIRKPLYVDAARITMENFDDIVAWCHGEVLHEEIPGVGTTKKYIKVRVHNPKNQRQTKAFIGDWLLYTERGYKVYTNKAFHASFDKVEGEARDAAIQAEKFVPGPTQDGVSTSASTEDGIDAEPVVGTPPDLIQDPELVPPGEIVTEQVRPPVISDSDTAPPPHTEDGRRILTVAEQREMDQGEITELLRSGEAVLAQDLV